MAMRDMASDNGTRTACEIAEGLPLLWERWHKLNAAAGENLAAREHADATLFHIDQEMLAVCSAPLRTLGDVAALALAATDMAEQLAVNAISGDALIALARRIQLATARIALAVADLGDYKLSRLGNMAQIYEVAGVALPAAA